MLNVAMTLRALADSHVALALAYEELAAEWSPDAAPPTLVTSAMANALLASPDDPAEGGYARVSSCIEETLRSADAPSKDAVATGFLEVVVSALDRGHAQAESLMSALGPLASSYCREWIRETGGA